MSRNSSAPITYCSAPRWRRCLFALFVAMALALTGCSEEVAPDGPVGAPTTDQQAKVTHQKVRVRKPIPFATERIETSLLPKGETQVEVAGRPGVGVRVIRISTKFGKVIKRDIVNRFVKRDPVNRVLLVGTKVEPEPEPEAEPESSDDGCDPNYAGGCVPIASDVDCAGGSGDGPEYVDGPVRVVGSDIYDLNRDDDNIACDS